MAAILILLAALAQQETPNRVVRCGPVKVTVGPVDLALRWLARHQEADGSWRAGQFGLRCTGEACKGTGDLEHDVGVTGLALLAFVRAGCTPESKEISRAVRWLLRTQDVDGCFGSRFPRYMYGHAVATVLQYPRVADQLARYGSQKARARFTWNGVAQQVLGVLQLVEHTAAEEREESTPVRPHGPREIIRERAAQPELQPALEYSL